MAVQFKTSGTVLFKASGTVAMDASCCCEEGVCCEDLDPTRDFFLTIDNFTLDGGETCDAGCVFGIAAKVQFGGPSAAPGAFITEACGNDGDQIVNYTVPCTDGYYLNMFSSAFSYVVDNCGLPFDSHCVILLGREGVDLGDDQPLGNAVCDPFFLQATVNITVYPANWNGIDAPCATGTMRVTITE